MNSDLAGETVGANDVGTSSSDADGNRLAGDAEALAAAAGSIQGIVTDTANDIGRTVSTLIREKPLFAVGLAAAVAYIVGRLRS